MSNFWRTEMSNLDNQPGRDDRGGFSSRTPNDRTGFDNNKTAMGAGTITAIVAAAVIAGALMLFGPWGNNDRSAVSNSTSATSNSSPGTTTGQTSGAPRVITPTFTPAAPTTTTPAPNAR